MPNRTLHKFALSHPRSTLAAFAMAIGMTFGMSSGTAVVKAQDTVIDFDFNFFNEAEQLLDLNTVELGIQLKRGLRVFLPEQEQFIDNVLIQVNNGRLSRSMVNIIYVWAKRRNPKVPFPYFQIVLRELAARRGVTL